MATFPQTVSYRDDKGQTAKVSMFVVNATAAGALAAGTAIVNAMDDLTNAANNGARGAYTSPPTTNTYGANATYESIEDKAVLTFQTSTGALHRYQIPAPLEGIFEADGETVKTPDSGGDAQQVLLDTFVAAMVGDAASRDGVLLASYIGGIRIRRKFQRKFNIFTQNPSLTGPGE
jgi:hypothetical protein